MSRRVRLQTAERLAAPTAALVEENAAKAPRVEQPALDRRAAAARPAVQKDNGQAALGPAFL